MRVTSPRPVADLVLLAMPALEEPLVADRIRRAWPRLVGPEAARRSRPETLSNGRLVVAVDNSPWLQELSLRAAELTERLGREFSAVRSLQVVLGPVPAAVPAPRAAAPATPPAPLTDAERRALDEATAPIRDPELAGVARRLLATAWRQPARGSA